MSEERRKKVEAKIKTEVVRHIEQSALQDATKKAGIGRYLIVTKPKTERKSEHMEENAGGGGGGGGGSKGRPSAKKKRGARRTLETLDRPPWELLGRAIVFNTSADYYEQLSALVQTESKGIPATVQVFGEKKEPRLKAYFTQDGSTYRYSGQTVTSTPWPPIIQTLVDRAHELVPGAKFTRVLVNWYRDGHDYIGRHWDKDGLNGEIASFSFYPTASDSIYRTFRISRKSDNALVFDQPMPQGSMVLMHPGMQQDFEHEVPKQPRISAGRINVTLRENQ